MVHLPLRQDWHVHSVFSDGTARLEENIARAMSLGLTRLGCVDHVRRDTTYVPSYVAAVRAAQARTPLVLTAGVEAKMLDSAGTLDLPALAWSGSRYDTPDLIYIADHQFPGATGPVAPRLIRSQLDTGVLGGAEVLDVLVEATAQAMVRAPGAVVAHLFSLVPKLGLSEDDVTDHHLDQLTAAALMSGATVEVSERWRCPGLRVVRRFAEAGIPIVCSTDSHALERVGRYDYVARLFALLPAQLSHADGPSGLGR
jgi:putative hydrolase